MMKKRGPLIDKSVDFSVYSIALCKRLKENKEFVIANQLLRASTSIGANISEAKGALSKKDFKHKLNIAYKESLETKYWLEILLRSKIISEKNHEEMYLKCEELSKMLYKSINNS